MKPLHEEEGWVGALTREHADGAIANGEPIIKVKAEDTDANPIGTVGTVLWKTAPHVAVAVIDWKIERLHNL